MVQYDPLRASSYLPLPKHIKDKKATLNIKNLDNRCFLWCILAALHNVDKNGERPSKYHKYINNLNMTGIKYPVRIEDITRFETLNNISVNVFGINED